MLSVGWTNRVMTRNCRSVSATHSGVQVEFVPEDTKGLRDVSFGDGKVDLTIGGEVEKLFWLASELQCADEDVGVSDDARHERVRDS